MVLTDIPTGIFADKFGRRLSLILSSLLLGVSTFIFLASRSLIGFIVYAVIAAVGWSLLSGSEEAYVYESSTIRKVKYRHAISDVNTVDEISTVFGLLFSAVLTKLFNINLTIFISASLLIISFIAAFFLLEDAPVAKNSSSTISYKGILSETRKLIKKNKKYVFLMIIFAIYYEGGRLLWQPQLTRHGLKVYDLGFIYAFFKIFSALGSMYVKKRPTNKQNLEVLICGLILSISFLIMGLGSLWLIIVGLCMYSFIENYTRVLQSDYINNLVQKNRATFLSLNNIIRNSYSAGVTPILGYLSLREISEGFTALAALQLLATGLFIVYALTSTKSYSN